MSGTKFLLELARMQLEFNADLATATYDRNGKHLESCPGPTLEPTTATTPPSATPATTAPETASETIPANNPKTHPTREFPLENLPATYRQMSEEISQCVLVPPTLSCISILGVISAAIGKGLLIQSKPNRTTPANLFIIGGGESASGKSTAVSLAAQPFLDFERAYVQKWTAEAKAEIEVEVELLKGQIAKAHKELLKLDPKDVEFKNVKKQAVAFQSELNACDKLMGEPSLSVDDITVEKLAMVIFRNDECITSLSADAGAIVQNLLGRYNRKDQTDDSIYLKTYSWDYIRVDRVGRPSLSLWKPCLSLLWFTQPEIINALLETKSLTSGGFLPRVMVCQTGCDLVEEPDEVPAINPLLSIAYNNSIRTLIQFFRLRKQPAVIQPTKEVMDFFRAHHNQLIRRRKSDLKDVRIFAARWTEWAWRIAACLHAATFLEKAEEHALTMETAVKAVAIADWFSEQALSILHEQRQDNFLFEKRKLVDKVLKEIEANPRGISARHAQRASIGSTSAEATKILENLKADGFLYAVETTPVGGGKRTRLYLRKKQ